MYTHGSCLFQNLILLPSTLTQKKQRKKQGAYKSSEMAKKASIAAIIIGLIWQILTALFETEAIEDGASDGTGGSNP